MNIIDQLVKEGYDPLDAVLIGRPAWKRAQELSGETTDVAAAKDRLQKDQIYREIMGLSTEARHYIQQRVWKAEARVKELEAELAAVKASQP